MKNVKKREIVSDLVLKQIKKLHQYDRKLAIWENGELIKIKENTCKEGIIKLVEYRILKNQNIINYQGSKILDKLLKKIIEKGSPVMYEDLSDEMLEIYAYALKKYFEEDAAALRKVLSELNNTKVNFRECNLTEVIKTLKISSRTSSYTTYYNVKKHLLTKELAYFS